MKIDYWWLYYIDRGISDLILHLGKSFDIMRLIVIVNIKWIEDILIKTSDFQQLVGKKALINDYFNDKTIIIDANWNLIQRPKKDKKQSYS
ncbi:hypothetical protein [Spiroplasma poulsonii]|uniref:hypothetical protein n=1 Tax=Spiroplasma poulsonii TaxID=2138 RepID=UPI001F4CC959|nr:hypothetical protein [Spiroplasma poulsonii]UNF61302.1 hypothetical protein MNU24_05145 [Spiroplasma poulsonii]